jgi:predicted nucleic acid-binding protein
MNMRRVYLDNCCLNRPFDDQSQARIRLEAEAVTTVIRYCTEGQWEWVGSDVLFYEIGKVPDAVRKERLLALARSVQRVVPITAIDVGRAQMLRGKGFKAVDAMHVVAAESAGCDVLLTTDDGMISAARRSAGIVHIPAKTPVAWLAEVMSS